VPSVPSPTSSRCTSSSRTTDIAGHQGNLCPMPSAVWRRTRLRNRRDMPSMATADPRVRNSNPWRPCRKRIGSWDACNTESSWRGAQSRHLHCDHAG
jgi:hypothetical protein